MSKIVPLDACTMLDEIMACGGQLLPVEQEAFRFPMKLTMSMLGSEISESRISMPEYYGNFGIKLGNPAPGKPGWHYCTLPDGWTLERLPDMGINGSVRFYDADHKYAFMLTTRRVPADTKCLICGYFVKL